MHHLCLGTDCGRHLCNELETSTESSQIVPGKYDIFFSVKLNSEKENITLFTPLATTIKIDTTHKKKINCASGTKIKQLK